MENLNGCQEMDSLQYKLGYLSGENRQLQEQTAKLASELDAAREENAELHYVMGRKDADHARVCKDLESALSSREDECCQLRDEGSRCRSALEEKEQERKDLEVALMCREGECQQLRDKENRYLNELTALRNSRAYRLGNVFAGIARFFVPKGSKRAVFARLLVNLIKHPRIFFSKLTVANLKRFFRLLRKGNVRELQDRMQASIEGRMYLEAMDVVRPEIIMPELIAEKKITKDDYSVLSVPQWENPCVSIVIPVYNQFEFTYHCVESILKNSGRITYEILIANDCSTDLTAEIEDILPGVRCITNEKNLRFLRNCNNAAKYARGKYILFLNNDTQVMENWLEPLVTLIESADDIGMVGSKLIYPDGTLQEAGGILWKDGSAWNFGNRQNPNLPQFNYVKQVDYISGASIMLSRSLWEEIGGFDEHFAPAYCEDSDLAFTVRKMGYRVMYQPMSVVVHFEGVSNGTDTSSGQKQYQIENSRKLYEKWKDELSKHPANGVNVFQARDRSYGQATVLMIDHYVPMYDQDAGSRTIYQYIKLLRELDYNVKFIGDNFFPHQPYTQELEQMGVEVLYGLEYMNGWADWVKENAEHLDVVFMNRPHISEKYIDIIKANTKAKIIYNLCDLHFLRMQREYELTGDRELRKSAEDWKQRELALVEKADTVFSLSTEEQRILAQYGAGEKTVICPIFIFDEFVDQLPDRTETKDLLFVGGFRHTPNVDAMEWFCAKVFPLIQKKLPDISVHIVGSNPPESITKYQSEHIIFEGFVTDEQLNELYNQSRVCVVPLRYGAGVKGKTIEAMYNGIPIVTTEIGIEGLPEIDRCITAHNEAEAFADAVADMYVNGDNGCAQRCYEFVRTHYSIESAKEFFRKEFE